MQNLRITVVQNGARQGYAVPAELENAGMMEAFYTDLLGNVGVGELLSFGRHLPIIGRRLNQLDKRRVPPHVIRKTVSFFAADIADRIRNRVFGSGFGVCLGRQMLRQGFGSSNIIYSSLGWASPFLDAARKRGIKVVTEFYVRPSLRITYQSEYRLFPDWEAKMPFTGLKNTVGSPRDPCTVSDFVIVPAEGVALEVAEIHRFPRTRICVVPYGVNEAFFQIKNTPVAGRVFFAGSCCLGKGIHYLAMAADRLLSKCGSIKFEFRAAGDVSELVRKQPICRGIKFLGRIPRAEIPGEYEVADLFVLPTLSEGSAGVTYEALAAGIPVITTRSAGSVVRDGTEGRIVPERDPDALAHAIAEIVKDREKRGRMAVAARERACDFTWERYGERLVAALKSFAAGESDSLSASRLRP
jgi:glycosyltransferase involved in cell wall biosynthesis